MNDETTRDETGAQTDTVRSGAAASYAADERRAMIKRVTERAVDAYQTYVWQLATGHPDVRRWEGHWEALHRILHDEAAFDLAEQERSEAA